MSDDPRARDETPSADIPTARHAHSPLGEPTLVEDVMLLLFQPDSGTIAGEGILFYVLAGAAVADLALAGKIEAEPGMLSTKVHAVADASPVADLLEPAWSYISEKPRGVQTVLAAVGPRLREPTLERLIERGDIVAGTKKTLGLFTTQTLSLGGDRRTALLAPVRAALTDGADVDARTAAAIALLSASDALPQFDREIPWSGDVYTRGKEFERGNWGAAAAASAVARTMAAIITSSVAAATVNLARN